MRRATVVLVGATAGLALLWVLLFAIAGRPAALLAAPRAGVLAGGQMRALGMEVASPVSCTLSITTTDSLEGTLHYTSTNAVPLANYTGLALAPGARYATVSSHDDWFALNNATLNGNYQVEALPDLTVNYNLGMIVYDSSLTPIYSDVDSASNNYARVTFRATTAGPYYVQVSQLIPYPGCTGSTYRLNVSVVLPTAVPGEDVYEQNDSRTDAYRFPVATTAGATDANFWPVPDDDWYGFYVKTGRRYQAYTSNLSGVDTIMELYDQNGAGLASDNDGAGGFASRIEWPAAYDGFYYLRIFNAVSSTSADNYDLTVAELSTATATPFPTATSVSGLDSCENNFDFDHACVIPGNQSMNFNLISPFGGADNDYFKIWVKPGLRFDCKTSDLSPSVDPNMIVYDQNRNGIGGNDDVSPGNYNSAFSYFSSYEGWLYVLVGTGNRTPSNLANSNYTLRCDVVAPGTPTPIPTSTPRPTSQAPTAAPPIVVTATPPPGLTWRLLTTPPPPAVATPSAPRFIPINLLVYYDANADSQPGAGEGIAGVSAQAYDAATGQVLAQGFTGEQGNLEFTVASTGPVRVSVPFFGFSQLVAGEGASIYLRIPPQSSSGGAP